MALVDAEMERGERIVWTGQPRPGRFALRALPLFLFAIPWTAFAVFWISAASGFKFPPDFSKPPGYFPLFGLPFVIIGLGLLTSPFWRMRAAKRTIYVITDRRAVTFSRSVWGTLSIQSYLPDRLRDLRRNQSRDGSGDLVFERVLVGGNRNQNAMEDRGFIAVRDVKSVEEMVRKLSEAAIA
jgi:hypothetical protein